MGRSELERPRGIAVNWRDPIESVGEMATDSTRWIGGLTMMLARTLARGVVRPWGVRDIVYQFAVVGVRSLSLTSIMSFFVGMILAWTIGQALTDFGAKTAIGNVTSLGLVRELVPSFLAVTVGCKMATGMTAELGSMKVTEQIDAISALGADPIKKLVVPRVVAATLTMPLLVAWGNVLALIGGMFISHTAFDVSAEYFAHTYIDQLVPMDYIASLTKALVFGAVAGTMGCYQGFCTQFGTEAVGQSTTQTVSATSIAVLLADFVLTTIFLPV